MTTSAKPFALRAEMSGEAGAELPKFFAAKVSEPAPAPEPALSAPVRRFRLLPLVMVCGGLLLGLKVLNIVVGTADLLAVAVAAPAESAGELVAESAPPPDGALLTQDGVPTLAGGTAADDPAAPAGAAFMSRSEINLLQDLAARRTELEARAKELDTRERLLMATEQRIDKKIERLKSIEGQINDLLKLHSDEEEAQLTSLVRVYESMKPKEAAVIFEKLDMPVLLSVIQRMKDKKMSAVMAAMNPEIAQKVTTELATRKQLPLLDGSGNG